MIDKEGNARIMDFGIARSLKAKGITGAGVMIGTPEYMSPEQAEGKEADERSDIYSLGVILYEMVTGRVPFGGDTVLSIALKHKTETPQTPKELNAQIPEELSRVILRCMEKQGEKRYQTIEALLSDLTHIERGLTTTERIIPEIKPDTVATTQMEWKNSVAVLPFADISSQKDQEYFCDGMTDDIITKLSKLEELKVISRTSVMRYKKTDKDIKEIGQALGVSTILEGSVQKANNYIRVNAQLINVEDGFHLWAETYDRELKNVFEIQTDIAEKIAKALKAKLSPDQKERLEESPTESLKAYDLYLKGRYFWSKRTPEGFQKSIEFFQNAIEKDPTYALAYTGIADYFNLLGYYSLLPPKEAFPKAKEAAEKALEIDETLAEAHASLGWIKTFYDWDWTAAEISFKRSIELNPGYENAHHWYAGYLGAVGRHDEAIAEVKRALKLDPVSAVIRGASGGMFMWARQYDQSIEELKKAIELDPSSYIPHFYLVYPYIMKGMYEEAIAEAQTVFEISGKAPVMKTVLGQAYAFSGKQAEGEKLLSEVIEISEQSYITPFGIASICSGLDQKDKALEWLEKAFEERDHWMYQLKVYPLFDSLRSDPRFKALLQKMGLDK